MLRHSETHPPTPFNDTEKLIRYIEDSIDRIVETIEEKNLF